MSTELSPEKDAFVERLVADGLFADRRQALDHAVDLLREESETVDAIRQSLVSLERGEGVPIDEAIRSIRQKYQIPEDA